MRRSLTESEIAKLPLCDKDWIKHPCDFEFQEGHKPTVMNCYDCMFEGFAKALEDENIGAATHCLECLRKVVKESAK